MTETIPQLFPFEEPVDQIVDDLFVHISVAESNARYPRRYEDNLAKGMTPEDARNNVLRLIPGVNSLTVEGQ